MSYMLGFILAILVGACVCLQPVFTSNIGKYTGTIEAAFISIITTFTIMVFLFFIFGKGDIHKFTEVPKYYFLAGVFGITIVVVSIFTVQILGPAVALSVSVSCQIIVSVLLEHFGLFGIEKTPVSITRIAGILFMIVGVVLIKGLSK